MSRVSTYLNFMGQTEEAFRLYGSVFGTQISGEIARMGDMPTGPDAPELSDTEKKLVAHVELPILGGHVLMGTDMRWSPWAIHSKSGTTSQSALSPTHGERPTVCTPRSATAVARRPGCSRCPGRTGVCTLDRFGIRADVQRATSRCHETATMRLRKTSTVTRKKVPPRVAGPM